MTTTPKFSYFLFIASFLFTALQAQIRDTSTQWKDYSLKGKVKKLTLSTHQLILRNDSLILRPRGTTGRQILEFSPEGKLLKQEKSYPRYSQNIYLTEYTYDQFGRQIKESQYTNEKLTAYDSTAYDSKNYPISKHSYENDTLESMTVFKYAKKYKQLTKHFYRDAQLVESAKLTYNKAGQHTGTDIYFSIYPNRHKKKIIIKYDSKNRIIAETNGVDSTQIIYEYPDTNTTNEFYYKDKQLTQQIFRTTSPKDKTTEEIEKDAQGKQITRRTTIFNEHNDTVERNRYNSENEQETHNHIRYRRKYDAKGNCTESIEFLHNGNPLEAALTEYIYFD